MCCLIEFDDAARRRADHALPRRAAPLDEGRFHVPDRGHLPRPQGLRRDAVPLSAEVAQRRLGSCSPLPLFLSQLLLSF